MTVQEFLAALQAHRNAPQAKAYQLARVSLRDADLSNADLHEVVFDRCDFSGAIFQGAKLEATQWQDCRLAAADFSNANLIGATFDAQCTFERTRFVAVSGVKASFSGNRLFRVDASGADFEEAIFGNALLTEADFSRANLQQAQGFILDRTRVAMADLSAAPRDPWSVLRRTYTGPRFAINLIFLVAFCIALAAKAYAYQIAALIGANEAIGFALTEYCQAHPCEEVRLLDVLLGTRESAYARVFIVTGLIYNGLRLLLTFAVTALRDQEERSARAPAYRPGNACSGLQRIAAFARAPLAFYGWMIWPHRMMRALWLIVVGSFVLAVWKLGQQVLLIPISP